MFDFSPFETTVMTLLASHFFFQLLCADDYNNIIHSKKIYINFLPMEIR